MATVASTPVATKGTRKGAELVAGMGLLRRLEWTMKHAVENVLSGEYRSVFRGRGMEFDQVVKYEFGDDIRDIDWSVTARLGEPYRKKFVEERELTVLLVIEDSLSLQFGSGRRMKREALLELACLVMLLGAQNRDRVGIVHAQPGGYTLWEPVRGRGSILHAAAQLLAKPAPDLADDRAVRLPWRFIAHAAPKHSTLVWLGDFAPRAVPVGWAAISRRYHPIGFKVDDAWERAMPEGKPFTAFDPSAQRLVVIDPASTVQRQAHGRWVAEREAAFAAHFLNPQDRLVVSADEPQLEALVRFFRAHMGGR